MNIFKRNIGRLLALIIVVLAASSVVTAQTTARVRFVHAIPGATAVDVYINGTLALNRLEFGTASTYLTVPAGTHTVTATPAGIPSLLWEQTITVDADQAAMLVASSQATLRFDTFKETLKTTDFGVGRMLLVHAIAGGPAVDVELAETVAVGDQPVEAGTVLLAGLAYGATLEFDLPARAYKFNLVSGSAAVINDLTIPVTTNTSAVAVVYGTPAAPQILFITTPTAPGTNTGLVRLVHGVVDAPPVDVVINDVLAVPALSINRPTEHIALPAGEHTVSLRAAGTEDEIFAGEVTVTANAAQTVVALQGDTGLELAAFDDAVLGVTASSSVVSVINAIPGSDRVDVVLEDGTAIARTVPFGEASTAATLQPVTSGVTFSVTIGDRSGDIPIAPQTFYGGVYYNLIALDGGAFAAPRLLVAPTSLAQGLASAPGAGSVTFAPSTTSAQPTPVQEIVTQPTPAAPNAEVVTQPTAVATQPQALPPGTESTNVITARILLDPGANLQLREFPSSDARSLGLAPSGTILVVNGRQGAPVALVEGQPEPPEAADFVDPVTLLDPADPRADLVPDQTWLNVDYSTPDGGTINAWVNAFFLDIRNSRNERVLLRDLPFVGGNVPGAARATALTPPPVPEDRLTAVVINLNPGTNLNIRRTPSIDGEVLARLTQGTVVELFGLNESSEEWAFIAFRPAEGGQISGWVNVLYIDYRFNGQRKTLEEIKEIVSTVTLLPLYEVIPDDRRGTITGGASGVALPTPDPLRDVYLAEVVLDPNANLQLRRTADANSESLNLIPAGTRLVVISRDGPAQWLKVTFEGETGWISAQFVRVTFNGQSVDLQEIPVEGSTPAVSGDAAQPTPVPTTTGG